MSLSDEHVELKILAIYRKVINQNLLMNCDPNLCIGENSTMGSSKFSQSWHAAT
jgi:hypothetical protein